MGIAADEEHGLTSPEAEEMLPLYQEMEGDSPSELSTPDSKATPDEVRDYIVRVMQSRGVGLDHARRVADRWTLGTGQELRSYPVLMFRDIFGPEDGWAVYKGVKVQLYTEELKKVGKVPLWLKIICLPFWLVIFFGSIGLVVSEMVETAWVVVPLFVLGVLGGIVGITFSIVLLCMNQDPEKRADEELQNNWHKTANNGK